MNPEADMTLSITSTLMTVIITNLLIFLCAGILKNKKLLYRISYNVLAVLLIFIIIRMLLPFTFHKSRTIELPQYCFTVLSALQNHCFHIGRLYFCIFDLLCLIWLGGIVYMSFCFIRKQYLIHRYMKLFHKDVTSLEPYASVMAKLCRDNHIKKEIPIHTVPGISTPLISGVCKPCILLPDGMQFTEKELHYVLAHELSHYLHKDTLIKALLQLITIVFWWNPACHILNKQANLLFELRVDNRLVSGDKSTMIEYLQCILDIAEQACDIPVIPASPYIGFARKEDSSTLSKRMDYMITRNEPGRGGLGFFIAAFAFLLVLFSYLYTPRTTHIDCDEAYFSLTPEDTYMIRNEDGSYDIYYLDFYLETVNSLLGYDTDIPIFEGKEEFSHESN